MSFQVKQNVEPKNDVKPNIQLNPLSVSIDFTKYPNWTKSVRVKDFTNQYKNEKDIANTYFKVVAKIIPFIQSHHESIISGQEKHNHIITGKERSLAVEIIKEIHGEKMIDENTEIWELSVGQNVRLISCIYNSDNKHIVIPLFIDPYHLLYPDKNYNQKDYGKKVCKVCAYKKYN